MYENNVGFDTYRVFLSPRHSGQRMKFSALIIGCIVGAATSLFTPSEAIMGPSLQPMALPRITRKTTVAKKSSLRNELKADVR